MIDPRPRSSHRRLTPVLGLGLSVLLAGTPVLAHKLKVFATAEGTRIQGSAYFAGGGGAAGARVEVRDAQGAVLATLPLDAQGALCPTQRWPRWIIR